MLRSPVNSLQVTHGQRLWLYLLNALVLAFLITPCLLIVPMSLSASPYLEFPPQEWSLRWYRALLESDEWRAAAWISIQVAVLTTLIATPLGTAAAYGLLNAGGRIARIARILFLLPMVAPSILVAVGLFFVYGHVYLNNTVPGLVLADSMLGIPYVVVTVGSGLAAADRDQELAARSLGANRFRAFRDATLPQIRFSMLSGALFAFATAFDEVVVALFVSGGRSSTLTKRIFNSIRDEIDPRVAAIASIVVAASILLLLGGHYLGRRLAR
jgi:putative spermidine/putrescine transport system permease protein